MPATLLPAAGTAIKVSGAIKSTVGAPQEKSVFGKAMSRALRNASAMCASPTAFG